MSRRDWIPETAGDLATAAVMLAGVVLATVVAMLPVALIVAAVT